MINQSNSIFSDTPDMMWFYGQVAVFFLLVVYGITLVQQGKKSETEPQREIFYGFSLFLLSCVFIQGFFVVHTWYSRAFGEYIIPRLIGIGGTGFEYVLLLGFAFGFIFLMHGIEKHILEKPKLIITKLNAVSFILLLLPYLGALIYTDEQWLNYWTYAAYPGVGIFAISGIITLFGSFLIYLRLGIKSTGSIRRKGFCIGFGLLAIYLGIIVGSQIRQFIGGWVGTFLGPGLIVAGEILTLYGQRIEM